MREKILRFAYYNKGDAKGLKESLQDIDNIYDGFEPEETFTAFDKLME